ncbi:MAG: FAD-dependent oxidoreductase [Brevundimonas sp.]|uniref:NAD(P)/FAD-dependent oxidoreductase n=1 Tax=Brevundimonas sp. TaxID=1871086 RepID=UPI002734D9FD|nr:FAD-dependent oxidoreductase [Brevundimonas sp.]MDP3406229.1 FAD-dependent oxidoreductase [Brevundimonas sp.]
MLTLALVGAGHAHLAVLARADRLRASGIEPVLIAPATFDYSGLASAILSGAMAPDAGRIDVAAVAERNGIAHAVTEVVGMDQARRRLTLGDGSVRSFDLVSFNIGSVVAAAAPGVEPGSPGVWPVKPLSSLFALRRALEAAFAAGEPTPAIAVVGDGPTGFEIAAALTGLHERHGRTANLSLIGPHADARWAPGGAGRALTRNLDRRGVCRLAGRFRTFEPGRIALCDGRTRACDHLVVATGLQAPALTRAAGLPLDDRGRFKLAPILCSVGDDRLFAAGDCATIKGWPRPFAGVFGVRAAPVLLDNLCASGRGEQPRPYRPQTRWLSIMDLGEGTGLAMRGGLWWQGRLVLALKRRLDLGFVARSRAG